MRSMDAEVGPATRPLSTQRVSLDDAMRIRREVLYAFEEAEACEDSEEKRRLMTVAIVGGGPTGVELAGAFAELARHVLVRDFRNIDTAEVFSRPSLPCWQDG